MNKKLDNLSVEFQKELSSWFIKKIWNKLFAKKEDKLAIEKKKKVFLKNIKIILIG